MWSVVERLLAGEPRSANHRRHRLSGVWSRHWECHVEPDWLLIWFEDDDGLTPVRTGSHADLFE